MAATVTRCDGPFDEAAVRRAFDREGLSPRQWSNGPGDVYAAHSHGYHKVLYCLRGSIVFTLTDSREAIQLAPGDRLDLEPGTAHSAVVGPRGVACFEAATGPDPRADKPATVTPIDGDTAASLRSDVGHPCGTVHDGVRELEVRRYVPQHQDTTPPR